MLLYENKAYQYVSDWCRFKALKKEGGVYLDTDHHLTKSFDELINSELTVVMQDHNTLSASFIASIPNHPIFDDILEDKKWNYTIASPFRVAGAIKKHFGISEYKRKPFQSAKLNIYPPFVAFSRISSAILVLKFLIYLFIFFCCEIVCCIF